MTLALAAGWAAWSFGRGPIRRRALLGVLVGLLAVAPVPAFAAGIAMSLWSVRARLAHRRRQAAAIEADLAVLADLVSLGLTAGLPVRSALAAAAGSLHPVLAAEVTALVATADRRGMAAALADGTGHASRLYRLLARAVVTGAPAADAVESYAVERRHADHAARLADARRLPVRLLLPLALLILPGFVVLAVGPALIDAVARLGGAG